MEVCTLTDGEPLAIKMATALPCCLPALRAKCHLLKMSHNGCQMIAGEKSEPIISAPNWPRKKPADSDNALCLGADELFRAKHWDCHRLSYLHPLFSKIKSGWFFPLTKWNMYPTLEMCTMWNHSKANCPCLSAFITNVNSIQEKLTKIPYDKILASIHWQWPGRQPLLLMVVNDDNFWVRLSIFLTGSDAFGLCPVMTFPKNSNRINAVIIT